MSILDRYIAIQVLQGTLLVLFVMTALFGVFSYIEELTDLGGNYGAAEAAVYTLLTLPRKTYEIFPTTVLLGGLLSLGNLASHSELVVMRAAGFSILRLSRSVMAAGLVLLAVAGLLGEVVSPPAERYAETMRSSLLSGYIALKGDYGFWARDGSSFVNIRRVLPGNRLEGIYIYQFDDQRALSSVTHAGSARYREGSWQLRNIRSSSIAPDRVVSKEIDATRWETLLNPDLLSVLTVEPESLSGWELTRYIGYLDENNLDAGRFRLAFWTKVMTPLSALVMLLVAFPFVFGSLRTLGAGTRVTLGVLIGLGFHLVNQALNNVGLVYGLSPFVSATLPSVVFAAGAIYMIRRIP